MFIHKKFDFNLFVAIFCGNFEPYVLESTHLVECQIEDKIDIVKKMTTRIPSHLG